MARSRDISKVLSSNTTLATDAEVAATYQTKASTGLTWIATNNFDQGSTGISFDNVFTSSYRNYRIVLSSLSGNGATQNLRFRLRKSAVDNSSSIYYIQYLSVNSTSVAGARVSTQTSWNVGDVRDQGQMASVLEVFAPNVSTQKTNLMNLYMSNSTTEPYGVYQVETHNLDSNANFDGFSIYPVSGNMYGYATVYGYKE